MLSRPDVLVLGGGGVLGQEWLMGVLAGIEDATAFDFRINFKTAQAIGLTIPEQVWLQATQVVR